MTQQQRDNRGGRGRMWVASLLVTGICLLFATEVAGAAGILLNTSGEADSAAPRLASIQVTAYAHQIDVPNQSAEQDLSRQARGSGLVEQLEAAQGKRFAGLWFDTRSGEFVVPQLPDAPTSSVKSVVEDTGLGTAAFRTVPANYAWDELSSEQTRIDTLLKGAIDDNYVETSLEPRTNSVLILEASDISTSGETEVFSALESAKVAVETRRTDARSFDAQPDACSLPYHSCDPPIRGGVYIESSDGQTGCTAGFNATGLLYGNHFILTAGHCYQRSRFWRAFESQDYYEYLGEAEEGTFPGSDFAKIKVASGSYWDSGWESKVEYWEGGPHTIPITTESPSYLGESVCHSGASSGSSCGIVTAIDKTVSYPEGTVYGLTEASGSELCAIHGDSGGPVWSGNTAVGLLSGSREEECGGHVAYYNEVTEADEAMGVSVGARANLPPALLETGVNAVQAHQATATATLDPNGQPTTFHAEYGLTTAYGQSTSNVEAGSGWQARPVSVEMTGLEPDTTYHCRLVANNGSGTVDGSDEVFTTPPDRPILTTEAATEIKAHTVTLHASVNPQGADTHYQFEYGRTIAYGSTAPIPAADIGTGLIGLPVDITVSGLEIGTTYHYRIVATNSVGTSYGADAEFKTPNKPVITAEAASYVDTLEPTINVTIAPERADTHYQFEYGTTEAYGTKVPIPAEDIGGGAAVMVEKGLKGLARSTTYHYRVTAENEVGVVHGADRSFTTLPPCKGTEQRCVWSLQEPSNPLPPSKFELKSVGCASSTFCVAAGKDLYDGRSFVDRWNGSSWSLVSGTVPGEIKHLSCLASGCVAVGISGGAAYSWSIAEYPAGGGSWIVYPIAPPVPSGASETVLDGVSCTSESACTAVGSYKGSDGSYHPLVERWNGSAWSLQSAPNPAEGTAQNAMLSVSCISIGCITVGEAAGKPVAETWISGNWALSSPKLPAGAKGGKLSSVSCTSTSCIAVGDSNEGVGTEKALAESFELLRWELMSAPDPAGAKGFVELAGVSCPSAGACTATGWYAPAVSGGVPSELKTLAEAWNGSSWTIQASTNSAQRYNVLSDVSCSAAGACTAVGQDAASGVSASPEPLAERWNGSAWSTQSVINPQEPVEDEMRSVSCASNTLCVAAGQNLFADDGFVEVWNGTEWLVAASVAGEARKISCASAEGCFVVGTAEGAARIWLAFKTGGIWGVESMTTPRPAGSTESVLDGVSCAPGGASCTAVGSYKDSGGIYHPLVERWNGSAWSLQSAPAPAEGTAQNAMLGVSCAAASSCVAVGEAAGMPVAETWNGSEWSLSSAPPPPSGAKGATLAAASCGSTKSCMAVGDSYEGVGIEKALAERWNGSAWSVVPTPTPAGAKGFVDLTDVGCLSPNACFSAGYYAPEQSGGVPVSLKSLVESWEGAEWTILSTPNLTSQTYNALAGISCTTSIDCTAVGGATSSITKRPPVQLVMRYE